jgi:hypothetical protein
VKKIFVITISLLCFFNISFGQNNIKVSGQIRHRSEIDHKDITANKSSQSYNLLRSRLNFSFSPSEDVNAFIQVQDSRGFGDEFSTLSDGNADNLDFHQAHFTLSNIFKTNLDLKIGRIEMIYGNQRLIGAVGWHNIGRSFDGAVLKFKNKVVSTDVFSVKEVEHYADENRGDRNILGSYSNIRFSKSFNTDAFVIWQRANPSDVLDRYTFGLTGNLSSGFLYNQTEFAYQGGKLNGLDVDAILFATNLGIKFPQKIKPNISVGYEYLSGDDDSNDGKVNVFDTMYATNHKFYGYMDYFLNIPAHTGTLGLTDMHVKCQISPTSTFTLAGAFHVFKSSEDLKTEKLTANSIGKEIDFTVSYGYKENVSFIGGLSFFTPGDVLKTRQGRDDTAWFYLMTVVNF